MRFRAIAMAFCMAVCGGQASHGQSVGESMSDFFEDINATSNYTAPQAGIGQQGGYFTGGSLVLRTPVETFRPVSIDFPSASGGCGGIDLFTGGFGFVDAEQFVEALKAIAGNAEGLAFQLALDFLQPTLSENMKDLMAKAQQINQWNIDSCEAAKALVSSVAPRNDRIKRRICEDWGAQNGIFGSVIDDRHECSGNPEQAAADPDTEKKFPVNKNVAWEAMKDSGFVGFTSREMAEWYMTLTGTTIIAQPGATNGGAEGIANDVPENVRHIAPRGARPNVIKVLLDGGSVEKYSCGPAVGRDLCIEIDETTVSTVIIPPSDAFRARVFDMLTNMFDAIQAGTDALNAEQKTFLENTTLPVYKIMSVLEASEGDIARRYIPQIAEEVALDYAAIYLDDVINDSLRMSSFVAGETMGDQEKEWKDGIVAMRAELQTMREEIATRNSITMSWVNRTMEAEQRLANMTHLRWSQQISSGR